jgi:hypothetical protein
MCNVEGSSMVPSVTSVYVTVSDLRDPSLFRHSLILCHPTFLAFVLVSWPADSLSSEDSILALYSTNIAP